MKYDTINAKAVQKLVPLVPSVSDSVKISLFVHVLGVLIKTGRYLPAISIYLTGMNFLLAVHDFLSNNTGFALLNSMFVIGGLMFAVQMRLSGRTPHIEAVSVKAGTCAA